MTDLVKTSQSRPIASKLKFYNEKNFTEIPQMQQLSSEQTQAIKTVASILPFRVNQYVIDELIDWSNIPDDPIFQMTIPQRGMLSDRHFQKVSQALSKKHSKEEFLRLQQEIRAELNPHPASQQMLNVPTVDGLQMQGIQHKYKQTMLFFPSQGQTCHSYCTFCFRWAQFVGDTKLKFAEKDATCMIKYIQQHPELTDVIFTGGDPMIMKTSVFARYLDCFFSPELAHVTNIRIGTKSLSYWPARFVTDSDADDFLYLLERLVMAGKHVTIMAHTSHPRELENSLVTQAIKRIQSTGAVIRSQGPLLRHVNNSPEIWVSMWRKQVSLGIIPYYMFIERDTGPKEYFKIPLYDAWATYQKAITQLSGLARTVRGPSMSTTNGKVEIQGAVDIAGEKAFVLRYLQARNPDLCYQPFFAKFDRSASWFDQLMPFGESDEVYFE